MDNLTKTFCPQARFSGLFFGRAATWISLAVCVCCGVRGPFARCAAAPATAPTAPAADVPPASGAADERPKTEPQQSTKSKRGPTDPAELEAFVDGVMAAHLRDKHIAGATIAFVVDGKPFFAKGYGYADAERKKPVRAGETMFRIGSVSKLFTWTAVMQLVEQGKLDLNTDVNQYLTAFKVPRAYPQPITLKHILTHTQGFEDHVIGLFARDPDKLIPLGQLLARELPSRVRPPGELASYSNHGTALAGYIVSQVAGIPWEDYIEQNILQPLEMNHTTVRQPAADTLPPDLSKGYKFERGKFVEQSFEYVPAAPAGSMSASAEDMTHFMIAHLADGQYGATRILKEETARQMRDPLFTHDPTLPGMAYGFMRMTYNGYPVVQHGGDTFWFHSYFVMLPEQKAGFFVSYNTETAVGVRESLFEALLDHYYPANDVPPVKAASEFHDTLSRYVGSYGAIRHSYSSPAKMGALFAVAKVTADGDTLLLRGSGEPRRFAEVAPLVFREIDGQNSLAFRETADGRITHLFASSGPAVALERLTWSETPWFNIGLVVACGAVFLSALLLWPVIAFVNRDNPAAAARSTAGSRRVSWLAWLTCLAIVALVGLSLIPLSDPEEIAYGIPPLLAGLLWATPIVAALAAVVALCTLIAWAMGYWRLSGRLHYTVVLLAMVAFVWFLNHWNLLRFGP